jgi:hypothetical protein
MRVAAIAIRIFAGLDGAALIILGIFLWTGNFDRLIPIHMTLGILLVLTLWIVAAMAAFRRVSPALTITGAIWGALVVALGLTQMNLVPGDAHWVIQVIHLLVGLVALALTQILATRVISATPAERDTSGPSRVHA